MVAAVKSRIRGLLTLYPRWLCRQEFERQAFSRFNERPIEYGFVFRKLAEIYPQNVLDVGTGTTALPQVMRDCGCLVTATDNVRDYWQSEMFNRHYHILEDDITATRLAAKFDLVTCVSVLEHIERSEAAVRNMVDLLAPDGYLILTFPYNEREYVRNVYELPGSSYGQDASYITQAYSRVQVEKWLRDNPLILVEQEHWQFWEGDFWTVGRQVLPPRRVAAHDKHQLSCLLFQRRG